MFRRREFVCMICIKQHTLRLMISFSLIHKTSTRDFNAATKCVQKNVQQGKSFHLKVATATALMSGDVLAMKAIYNFYMRII